MPHKSWTTEPQREWLEARLADFREAQEDKTTAKIFFPKTFKAWKEQWPASPPTEQEITDAGSLKKAGSIKNKKLDAVRELLTYLLARS